MNGPAIVASAFVAFFAWWTVIEVAGTIRDRRARHRPMPAPRSHVEHHPGPYDHDKEGT